MCQMFFKNVGFQAPPERPRAPQRFTSATSECPQGWGKTCVTLEICLYTNTQTPTNKNVVCRAKNAAGATQGDQKSGPEQSGRAHVSVKALKTLPTIEKIQPNRCSKTARQDRRDPSGAPKHRCSIILLSIIFQNKAQNRDPFPKFPDRFISTNLGALSPNNVLERREMALRHRFSGFLSTIFPKLGPK